MTEIYKNSIQEMEDKVQKKTCQEVGEKNKMKKRRKRIRIPEKQ